MNCLPISGPQCEEVKEIVKLGLYDHIEIKQKHDYVDHCLELLKDVPKHLSELRKSDHGVEQSKNNSISDSARSRGNTKYHDHKWMDALGFYNKSICYAKPDSVQLAMGYANRSALLFERKFYKECLEDIEKALNIESYTSKQRQKLIDRETEAKKLLPTQEHKRFHPKLPELKSPNPNITAASSSVKINNNQKYGRFIEATQDIEGGEIIAIEPPYAIALKEKFRRFYCAECAEFCLNLIPCLKCTTVMYCCKPCRDKAFKDHHRYECIVVRYYDDTFMPQPLGWVALRSALKGLKEFQDFSNMTPSTNGNVYRSDRYEEIFDLESLFEKASKTVIMELAFNVAKIFYVLKDTDLLRRYNLTENTLKMVLLKEKLSNAFNVLPIQVYTPKKQCVSDSIGAGLYAFGSLFNHSCVENVDLFSYGATVVFKASRKIRKGEQCFINYGMPYQMMTKSSRQEKLQVRYMFTCDCLACKYDWPKIGEAGLTGELQTADLTADPNVSAKLVNLMRLVGNENGVNKITDENREEVLEKLFEVQELIRAMEPSNIHLVLAEILNVAMCYGNTLYEI